SVRRDHLLDDGAPRSLVRDVEVAVLRPLTELVGHALTELVANITEHDSGAELDQQPSLFRALPTRPARDHGDHSREIDHLAYLHRHRTSGSHTRPFRAVKRQT